VQSPTAAANASNYQLPQPVNSGTLDISTIKPASSGTVSIADAIAKARGIAAEKGINFDARNGEQGWPFCFYRRAPLRNY
jgi:far upstream element-binding protein